jgi:hypothetical protein
MDAPAAPGHAINVAAGRRIQILDLADGLPELAEWVAGQTVTERGDEAVAEMRARNLVG